MNKMLLVVTSIIINCIGFSQKITEVCPSNSNVWEHSSLGFTDWIEIHNTLETTINLEGWTLTNDLTNPQKWTFPVLNIDVGELAVLPAMEDSNLPNVISFSCRRRGEKIYLLNPVGEIIDWVYQPYLEPNHSYGRIGNHWFYFDNPTPGESNEEEIGYLGYTAPPEINRPSGGCKAGTNIVIRSENYEDEIHYSTNGTNPLEGKLYTEPIVLNEMTNMTIVAKRDSLLPSAVQVRTYIVGLWHQLPIVNITLDSLEMFDEADGIYMEGLDTLEDGSSYNANYWQDNEIHVYYEYFDESQQLADALDCNLKIFGNGSRVYPLKSLQLRAQDIYEKSEFNYHYFKEKNNIRFKRLVLRNSGGDFCNSCIKDGALHKYFIDSHLDVDLLGFHPVVVYINGNYWGIENLREKMDRYYFESNYGVTPDSVNLLEKPELSVINGSADSFIEVHEFAIGNDLGQESNYQWLEEHLDIHSMVDYFIIQLYINNRDWPGNNLKLWNAPGQKKWRYACFDLDAGFRYVGNTVLDAQSLNFILSELSESNPHVAIFAALLENVEFKRYFINRYADLLNSVFIPELMFDSILREKSNVEMDMTQHYEKWCGDIGQWNERFNGLSGFVNTRHEIVHEELSQVFHLPKVVEIAVSLYPVKASKIKVNSLELDYFPFRGKYYTNNIIDLEVVPNAGEIFEYWENNRTGERFFSEKIAVNPQEGDNFIAVFKPNGSLFKLKLQPNPVEFETVVQFSLPQSDAVDILVSSPDGRVVYNDSHWDFLSSGTHKVKIDLSYLVQGIYYVTIKTPTGHETVSIFKL